MKIIQEHKKCIGCGSCVAVCPKFWEMTEDGKAKPINAVRVEENYELEAEGGADCCKTAADSCPVACIVIKE
ncbi:MAG: ferredoxin [bacterium]|nr:ferredoxin [bacterium]